MVSKKLPYLKEPVLQQYLNPYLCYLIINMILALRVIDPMFGKRPLRCCVRSKSKNLDVFNHTGSDKIFNRDGHTPSRACQSEDSPYFGWYIHKAPMNMSAGGDGPTQVNENEPYL